jgi:hypothetical protein
MLFSELGSLGAVGVIDDARTELVERGFIGDITYEPYSNRVNVVGALAAACGAKNDDMAKWDGDLETAPVKKIQYALFMEIITYLEAHVDADIDEWCQEASEEQSIEMLRRASERIVIAVI